ncbi:MAG: bifunctional riboflavin kinase/FAD synthetase [Kiritimatiellae bacterium]|nr:bifunctional riboflavin kinase/FAD synthetase [Kiritimatiellia bacterium]
MRASAERCLAVGVFDGVHLGHRAILDGVDKALTFSTHPLALIDPQRAPDLIMPLAERVEAIKACGVKEVEVLDFTWETAGIPAEDFAAKYFGIGSSGTATTLRCGANWRFGRSGEGDAAWLAERGVKVEVVPYAMYRGEAVSSSRIRRALASGEIGCANDMLGRRYSVSAGRSPGKGRGAAFGFPTVNLEVPALLACGVYEVEMSGKKGIANYGFAPTMGDEAWNRPVLEVHLLDVADDPGNGPFRVEFLRFVRTERRFASVGELRRQIAADIKAIS